MKHTGKAQTPPFVARFQAQPSGTSPPPRSWSLPAQTSEMAKAGLDSSYLSPFLPEPDLDPPYVYPPVEIVDLDPHSEEYFQKLVAALDLDTESYVHVDPTIMTRFKDLIRKYAHAFYLPGTTNITPFFLIFGRDAPSLETISLDLPVKPLPPDHYAKHMLSRMQIAYQRFTVIKSDIRRHQKAVYDRKAHFLAIPPGKVFYIRKEPQTYKTGEATRFLHTFDGPFLVTGHPYDRNDLLTLKHLSTGAVLPGQVNIEKCVVVPDQDTYDLQPPSDSVFESETEVQAPPPSVSHVNSELSQVAYEFGKYLSSLPNKTATASQACKQVYMSYPSAREILTRHGKLHGLVKSCPYLQMDGAAHGGLYLLLLNQELFSKLFS